MSTRTVDWTASTAATPMSSGPGEALDLVLTSDDNASHKVSD
jgi:hypothetical protein